MEEQGASGSPRDLGEDSELGPTMLPRAWTQSLARANDPFADARVVIVDDDASNVQLIEHLLRDAGASNLHAVTDARVAVDRCLEIRPDIVLLDLHMPYVDGHSVLASLRRQLPSDEFLPVLVLTADTTSAVRERALDAGANDFVTKPYDRVEVVQRVRNLLTMRALYRTVQRHNAELRAELDAHARERHRIAIEGSLRRSRVETAISERALRMVFQPIVDLAGEQIVGVEALARFDRDPPRSPEVWFAEAAEVGLAVELDLAAIDASLEALGRLPPDIFLSVNCSPATATSGGVRESVNRVDGRRIVLELTEHTRIDDYTALIAALDDLRGQGVRIAVDDAGAGYAGLRQILRLHPDIIKLDVELTRGIDADPVRRALAASLVTFGRDTDALIIAEGIETADELDVLRSLGVRWGQGYHLARPGPLPIPRSIRQPPPNDGRSR